MKETKYTVLHRHEDGTVLEVGNERTDKREAEIIRQNTARKIFEEIDRIINSDEIDGDLKYDVSYGARVAIGRIDERISEFKKKYMEAQNDGTCRENYIHGDVCGCRTYEDELCDNFKDKSLFIELPCKVGDTVYMPWEWNGAKGIACLKVTTMSNILGFDWSCGTDFDTDDEGYADEYNCGRFKFDDIGKTVFLTREEAEAKMIGGAE